MQAKPPEAHLRGSRSPRLTLSKPVLALLSVAFMVAGFAAGFIVGQLARPTPSHTPATEYEAFLNVSAVISGTWGQFDGLAMAFVCWYNYTVTVYNGASIPLDVNATTLLTYHGGIYGNRNVSAPQSWPHALYNVLPRSQSIVEGNDYVNVGLDGSMNDCPTASISLARLLVAPA